jgi:hypothetical protein
MRTRLATTIIGSAVLLTGCSLTSNFDDFKFGSAGSGAADGGMIEAGSGGSSAAGTGGTKQAGAGGRGVGTAGMIAAGGAGGSSGAGGKGDDAPPCTTDADCGDTATYHCLLNRCLVRRVPSGVWLSGGGGTTKSAQFVLHISVGAPAPMGVSSSKNYLITVGAGAGRP